MIRHSPSTITIFFLIIFLVIYIGWLLRNTIKNKIDLYDLLLLSTVAIVPTGFVLFSDIAYKISDLLGVTFPFVLLFGLLFLLVFVSLYRLVKRVNMLSRNNVTLIQEISFLKHELDSRAKCDN
ncbi:MAG: DUF2304 domain-containing protein [bacterium]|nr:DUF2304 domain-containing protein [bacterium]